MDVQLLSELQIDCKHSLAVLGERVGLSAAAVMKRLRKLEQGGYVRGYRALLEPKALGLDVTAFVGVSINFPREVDSFIAAIDGLLGVQECHHVTGRHSLLLKVRAANTGALEELISHIQRIDAVERTETTIVLSTRVERTELPLPTAARGDR